MEELFRYLVIFFTMFGLLVYFYLVRTNSAYAKKAVSKMDMQKANKLFEKSILLDGSMDYQSAIKSLDKAISICPNKFEYYILRGNIKMKLSSFKDAIKDFTQAIRIKPTRKTAYIYRKNAYMEIADFQKAFIDLRHLNCFELENPYLYIECADVKLRLGEVDNAIKELGRALDLASIQSNGALCQDIIKKLKELKEIPD